MTDPLGLTPEQRALSDAFTAAMDEAPWWTPEYRDMVAAIRAAENLIREDQEQLADQAAVYQDRWRAAWTEALSFALAAQEGSE